MEAGAAFLRVAVAAAALSTGAEGGADEAPPLPRAGSVHLALGVTLHRIVVAMIGRMIRACGADDVAVLD